MPAFDTLLAPDVEQQHPDAVVARRAWPRRSPCSGSAVRRPSPTWCSAASRGPSSWTTRTTRRVSRWLLGMSIDTDRELLRAGREHDEPYRRRPRHDPAGDRCPPRRPRQLPATRCATPIPPPPRTPAATSATTAVPHSASRSSCSVTSPTTTGIGYELVASATRTMQDLRLLGSSLTAGLLSRDEAAIARRHRRRRTRRRPTGSRRRTARLADRRLLPRPAVRPSPSRATPACPTTSIRGWTARDAIERNDPAAARALGRVAARTAAPPSRRSAHAISGLLDGDQDEWHEALQLADEHGLRLIAVDALEALGAAAAAPTLSRSTPPARRRRTGSDDETGYPWRFDAEQATLRRRHALRPRRPRRRQPMRPGRTASPSISHRPSTTRDGHEANANGPATAGPASPRRSNRSSTSSPTGSPTRRSPNGS